MQSDAIIVEKEPERLKQLEAIREQATMLHESRLNKDKVTEGSVVKLMRDAVIGFMAAVDQDKEDGLDPNTARLWKGLSGSSQERHRPGAVHSGRGDQGIS
jgi:hypothetical protein